MVNPVTWLQVQQNAQFRFHILPYFRRYNADIALKTGCMECCHFVQA